MTPEVVCGAENPHTGRKCQRWHGHDGLHEYSGGEGTQRWLGTSTHSAFTPLVAETAKLEIERLRKLAGAQQTEMDMLKRVVETKNDEIERLKTRLAAHQLQLDEAVRSKVSADAALKALLDEQGKKRVTRRTCKSAKCDCLKKAAARVDEVINDWKCNAGPPGALYGAMLVYDTLREDS